MDIESGYGRGYRQWRTESDGGPLQDFHCMFTQPPAIGDYILTPIPSQTEKDFAEIAGAGLNFLRIPIPWWAIEVQGDEPFLPRVSWKSVLLFIIPLLP